MATDTFPGHWPITELHALGHRGRVAVVGAGRPVVLLPSLFALPRTYRPLVERLAEDRRVFVVEVPGSGNGERLDVPLSLDGYGRWVADVLRQLGLSGVTLIGHSHAGAVAAHVAHVCPERIGRLILVDAIGAIERPHVFRMIVGGVIDLGREWKLVRRAWVDVAGNAVRHPRTVLHHLAVCFAANVLGIAAQLRVPTTVAWGGRDGTLPPDLAERFAAAIPEAALVICAAGSHAWPISHAEEFARIV
ncbi:alpha/beta fold hydrolase [Limnoglobus roseus]|uniref:Alpha/beta hydrolase n=1 Tax=Limnoglobus roseus TaxID=2598579 RepID=A0A5C1AJU6_9BACT|nr:alpha/beta fold hydrolase [Limnoglobus roseus]QEL19140.1 alpha/beta hydrolase [Limnoglobus roseus]